MVVDFIIELDAESLAEIDTDDLELSLSKKLKGDFMGARWLPICVKISQGCAQGHKKANKKRSRRKTTIIDFRFVFYIKTTSWRSNWEHVEGIFK